MGVNIKIRTKQPIPVATNPLLPDVTENKIVYMEPTDITFTYDGEFKFKTMINYYYQKEVPNLVLVLPPVIKDIKINEKPVSFSMTKTQIDSLEAYIKNADPLALTGTHVENFVQLIVSAIFYTFDNDPQPVFGLTSADWELVQ